MNVARECEEKKTPSTEFKISHFARKRAIELAGCTQCTKHTIYFIVWLFIAGYLISYTNFVSDLTYSTT